MFLPKNIKGIEQWGGEVFQNLLQKIKQSLQYDIQLYAKQRNNVEYLLKRFKDYFRCFFITVFNNPKCMGLEI